LPSHGFLIVNKKPADLIEEFGIKIGNAFQAGMSMVLPGHGYSPVIAFGLPIFGLLAFNHADEPRLYNAPCFYNHAHWGVIFVIERVKYVGRGVRALGSFRHHPLRSRLRFVAARLRCAQLAAGCIWAGAAEMRYLMRKSLTTYISNHLRNFFSCRLWRQLFERGIGNWSDNGTLGRL